MITLFWTLLGLIIYCYFGYPLLVYLWAKIFSRPVNHKPIFPSVSIVIAAHNEADVILAKIKNLQQLDYPTDKIEILIGSDGSDDGTQAIIKQLGDSRIKLFDFIKRRGKMAVVNDLVEKSIGEIIFFNDARQTLNPDCLKNIVSNFNDPTVGCVSGELVFMDAQGQTAKGVNLYWRYEKFIRNQEALIHSMLGATGAIYAIRRSLFEPAPLDVILDDMYTPLQIVLKGYRAIFDSRAIAYDKAAESAKEEYRRKARTLSGNYQIFALMPGLFNFFKSPVAVQIFSHKLLRVLIPFFMILLLAVNALLVHKNFIFEFLFILQFVFYIAALLGACTRNQQNPLLKKVSKLCYIPYVFCLLNFAALVGFIRFLGNRQEITWQKARQ